jgi:hypothetical protein
MLQSPAFCVNKFYVSNVQPAARQTYVSHPQKFSNKFNLQYDPASAWNTFLVIW